MHLPSYRKKNPSLYFSRKYIFGMLSFVGFFSWPSLITGLQATEKGYAFIYLDKRFCTVWLSS